MGGWGVVAGVFIVYAAAARRLDRWSISAPMVMVVTGIVLGAGFVDVLPANPRAETVRLVTEITLALILFSDASTVRVRQAKRDAGLPLRLLGIGLPLTIGLGAVVARLVLPGVSWPEAALIATILAPTDAALGLAVVTNPAVPSRIRRALNIESGLNDGIATPLVTVFLAMVVLGTADDGWAVDSLYELARGAVIGVLVGYLGGRLIRWASSAEWSTPMSEQLMVLSLAFSSFGVAVAISGNGFVAAFVAGLAFGAATRGRHHDAIEFTDTVGLFSSFVVWVLFGAIFAGPVLRDGVHLRPVVYAVLSLTVVRMVPVAISLVRSRLRTDTVAFMGWFGPRGLASVVFTLIAFDEIESPPAASGLLELTTWTILASVLLHGITSGPLAAIYGRRIRTAPPGTAELDSVAPARVRTRGLL